VNFRNAPQAPLAENLVPLNQFRRFRTQIAGRVNLEAQAHALRDFGQAPVSLGLYPVLHARHDRIILTGMGASHVAAFPSWRRLVSRGKAAWWIDAASLLENPQLVTSDSLVIATSRSGMCAGVAALVERFDEINRPAAVVAITDNLASPLAEAADCELLLRSQSSGNARGFLNALAAHDYVAAMILNEDNDDPSSTARGGRDEVSDCLGRDRCRCCVPTEVAAGLHRLWRTHGDSVVRGLAHERDDELRRRGLCRWRLPRRTHAGRCVFDGCAFRWARRHR
jgi:D-arabinose 5-phosphate isomerase GutQ